MSYRIVFVINSIIDFLFGLGFLFVPTKLLDQFGTEARVPELLLARFFGSALVTIGLLLWFAKDVTDANVQKRLEIAMFVGSVLVLIVTVIGVSPASGVIRSNGWITMLIYALLALGYGYLIFLKSQVKE